MEHQGGPGDEQRQLFLPWISFVTLFYALASAFISFRLGHQVDTIMNIVTAVACAASTWLGRLGSRPNYRFTNWVVPLLLLWTLLLTIGGLQNPPLPITAYTILPIVAVVAFSLHSSRTAVISIAAAMAIMLVAIIGHPVANWQLLVDNIFICCLIASLSQFGRPRIDVEEKARHLAELAQLDPLTGLKNRRSAQQMFESWEYDLATTNQDAAVLILDLDHFKQVNDLHGHNTGDRALRALAKLLQENVRPTDVVYRWGGEEFVVVLPGNDQQQLAICAERLRAVVAAYREEDLPPLTISGGLAMLSEGRDWLRTLGLADARLYDAKQDGRNRIVATRQQR